MIYVVCVDDSIMDGLDNRAIEQEIEFLRITNNKFHHKFQLRDERGVGDLFDIRIKKTSLNKFNLS